MPTWMDSWLVLPKRTPAALFAGELISCTLNPVEPVWSHLKRSLTNLAKHTTGGVGWWCSITDMAGVVADHDRNRCTLRHHSPRTW